LHNPFTRAILFFRKTQEGTGLPQTEDLKMTNAQNRQRWAKDQKKQAQAAFAATVKPVDVERAERLVSLRSLADTLSMAPWAAETLDGVRAEIRRLEA
jgi:hypothetical protein